MIMAPATLTEYEKARLKRIEDNAKYMEELGMEETKNELHHVVKSASSIVKPKKQYAPRNRETKQMRASQRVAAMTDKPSYKDLDGGDDNEARGERRRSDMSRNPSYMRAYVSTEEAREAEEAAMAVAQGLTHPCMVKRMVRSHVSSCFWLGLTSGFCKDHMPSSECTVILEDLDGKQWDTIYKAGKTALSGGWRGYAIDHKLDAGDALLFELIEPTKLKVHIFRAVDQPSAAMGEQLEGVVLQPDQFLYERSVYTVRAKVPGSHNDDEVDNGGKKRKKSGKIEADGSHGDDSALAAVKLVKVQKGSEGAAKSAVKGSMADKEGKKAAKGGNMRVAVQAVVIESESSDTDDVMITGSIPSQRVNGGAVVRKVKSLKELMAVRGRPQRVRRPVRKD